MTNFFFVRHGKTKWNLEGRLQGAHGDSPLLPASYRDITRLANYLKHERIHFQAIYTSPLLRAQTTAVFISENLNQQNLPIYLEKDLREFNLGVMEGKTFQEVEVKYPHEVNAFRHRPDKFQAERIQAESFTQLILRMRRVIVAIAQRYPQDSANILIVSHGAALTALMQSLLGTPLKDLRKDGGLANTSLTELATHDQGKTFQKIRWNETSYLGKKLGASDSV
ncbi:histidine phosphatase family protein [Lapidilactobacillus luobeiensis]|uniref:histidine phosphatase family protein n=1 Tax=Lapidilactobacillus luobeiensis TaxID=2950371 RepID=UPI0021C3E98F|nr:histidine phosphatase family protein [Lapidilactobacillus luobeiensis]